MIYKEEEKIVTWGAKNIGKDGEVFIVYLKSNQLKEIKTSH